MALAALLLLRIVQHRLEHLDAIGQVPKLQMSVSLTLVLSGWLWLKNQRRPTDSLAFELESHVNMVGDLDEGNALVHPIVLAVEGHCSFNFGRACSLPGSS